MDLIIRNAKLRSGETVDIGISAGKITSVLEKINSAAPKEIDAKGALTTPAFIDPHIHLDKVNILDVVRNNVSGTLTEAIEIIWDKKRNYTVDDVVVRASEVVEKGIGNAYIDTKKEMLQIYENRFAASHLL